MKKKILIFVLIIILLSIGFTYSDVDDYYVRIRVRKPRQENEQVEISGVNSFTVLFIENNHENIMFEINNDNFTVRIDSYYDADNNYQYYDNQSFNTDIGPYHLKLSNISYNSYYEAKIKVEELKNEEGLTTYIYYNDNKYEIWTGMFVDKDSASLEKNKLKNKGFDCSIIEEDRDRIVIYDTKNNVIFMYENNYNIYFSSYDEELDNGSVFIDGKKYRGMIGFYIIEDFKLVSINRLDIESYLYGVVPNEMSPSWPLEAIKAQAVAARTYAVSYINPYAKFGYDMVDNQNNQVYSGYTSEYENSNLAVDETKGQMVYYDNRLIKAYFHSTSGGKTANSENVWAYPLPYAKAADDEFSNISPYTTWSKSASSQYILDKLAEEGESATQIYNMYISEVASDNRILKAVIDTDKGNIEFEKESIRKVLGYGFLLSTWFDIDYNNKVSIISIEEKSNIVEDNISTGTEELEEEINSEVKYDINLYEKTVLSDDGLSKISDDNITIMSVDGIEKVNTYPSEYIFNGRGWGHGVGMSQFGAKQMALEGYKYTEILKHYYNGVEIK